MVVGIQAENVGVLFGHVHSSGGDRGALKNADRVDLKFMFRFLFRLLAWRC